MANSVRFQIVIFLLLAAIPAAAKDSKPREVPPEQFLAGEALLVQVPVDTGSFLNGFYPIDAAGLADLPITGRIVVAGKTRQNIEQYLGGIWAPFLRDTHVRVTPAIRVAVTGNVHAPGFYFASPDAAIFDVVRLAGGPVVPDKLDQISHVRAGKVLHKHLAEQVARGFTLREAGMISGDEVMLPITYRFGVREAIPLIATSLSILLNAITVYYLVVEDRR
jgi:protein involved in polysaccharide export with SLBB domain